MKRNKSQVLRAFLQKPASRHPGTAVCHQPCESCNILRAETYILAADRGTKENPK